MTFEEWMKETLDAGQIKDLSQHGADCGWPGLCYYSDTCALYEEHEEEIWEALAEDAEEFGHSSVIELIGTFGGAKNVHDLDQLQNLLVWYLAERTAHRLAGD